jgi:heme/copper-type cytochrome/quinol oxidase subunit 2
MPMNVRRMRTCLVSVAFGVAAVAAARSDLGSLPAVHAQDRGAAVLAFNVRAHKYAFEPTTIDVLQDDLVRIVFRADDIAHSFTIDDYRISKRAEAGQTVTFEFRAGTPGRFPFYCDLRSDDGCRRMKGELVVKPR